ncbi:Aste57867_18160 [Aphanomyces stellatus]|uniref:Tubulin--tyrosine ligase-like protein 5 n=1 Tax=Aphanomyces stellatus TaxID=120398 RepID=A0A485LB26_9STRA|nr:hypothetical protein As57867_018098 [Aphanomyces stellatus]VFT94898.1 Aste57867_18160 [Aphanomyces stellatus]
MMGVLNAIVRWWVPCLLALVAFAQDVEEARGRKVYLLPQAKDPHVALLVDAFAHAGVHPLEVDGVEVHSWDAASRVDEYDLLWSTEETQLPPLGPLHARHKANRLPGSPMFSPAKLVERNVALQIDHSRYDFNFIPPEFTLPRDHKYFLKAFDAAQSVAIFNDRPKVDRHYKHRWRVFGGPAPFLLTAPAQLTAQSRRVVQVIEPLLISGHKFHLGLYVVVASIDPLRVYIYHNVLLRMCKLRYPEALDDATPREAIEVTDSNWLPPWEMPDLKAYYTEIPSRKSEGTSNFHVLKRHLEHLGVDTDRFTRDLHGAVVKMLAGNRGHFAAAAARAPSGASSDHYFELFRFDFEVEDSGKPWLVGVDASPSFAPVYFLSGSIAAMQSNVATDMLHLVGVSAPRDKVAADLVVPANDAYCANQCLDRLRQWDVACWRCPGWLPPPVATKLYTSVSEYARRGRFILAFPTIQGEYAQFVAQGLTAHDEAFHAYLMSFAYDPVQAAEAPPVVLCVNREQCSHHGDCVNGQCRCDRGFEGNSCYIPVDPDRTVLPLIDTDKNLRKTTDQPLNDGEQVPARFAFHWVVLGLAVVCYGGYRVAVATLTDASAPDKSS